VYGNKALNGTQIYDIMKEMKEGKLVVDQRGFKMKRLFGNLAFVAEIAAEVESDRRVTVRKLTGTHGVSTKTIYYMLH
jgi:hypothetical protein